MAISINATYVLRHACPTPRIDSEGDSFVPSMNVKISMLESIICVDFLG